MNRAKSRFIRQSIERIRQTFLLKKWSSEREKKSANSTNHNVSRLVKVLYQYSFNPTTNMQYNLCNIGYLLCLIAYWPLFYLWFESLHYLTRLHYQKKTLYNFFNLYNNPSVSKELIFIYLVNYSLVNLTYKIKQMKKRNWPKQISWLLYLILFSYFCYSNFLIYKSALQ